MFAPELCQMTGLSEGSPFSASLYREIAHAKTSWISLICKSVHLNIAYVCVGKEKQFALAMFLPYMKYLWNDQMACISLLSAHKIVNVFEDYKCVSKYMKNDETERGKKDEWVQCENTCCWWGWTMYNGCIVLLSLQCEHPLGGTQNKLQHFFFFFAKHQRKTPKYCLSTGMVTK